MTHPSGMQIFATQIHDAAIDQAKAYIKSEGYDNTMVKIVKTDTQILVIVR